MSRTLLSLERWIFWIATISAFVFFILGGLFLYQYSGRANIFLALAAPDQVLVGNPFTVEARLTNNGAEPLTGVKIALLLPEGAASEKSAAERRVLSRDVGSLAPKETFTARFPVTLYTATGAVRRFTATASYAVSGVAGGASVDVEDSLEVVTRDPALTLDLEAPQQVLNDSIFTATLRYRNNAAVEFDNARISLVLPKNIELADADPEPTAGTTEWVLPPTAPGSGGTIVIRARARGADASFFEIRGAVRDGTNVITEKSASVAIAPSPLSIAIRVDGATNGVAYPDQTLRYALTYQNNANAPMRDVVIKARVASDIVDPAKVRARGSWNSQTKTITWNAAAVNALELVRPGASGAEEFEITLKSTYPIKRLADKNMTIAVSAEISSPTIPYYVTADKTAAVASIETKVGGRTTIAATGLFRNSNFENRGPFPLKVNTPTTLTVKWTLTNYTTDVTGIAVRASLLAGVRMTGKVKSNVPSTPLWNERTGEVAWTIDRIPAAKGVLSGPVEAEFQIEATPGITHLNQPMPLMTESRLAATDAWTGAAIAAISPALQSDGLKDVADRKVSGVVGP